MFLILVVVVWVFYCCYVEKFVCLKRGFKSGLVLIFIGVFMLLVFVGNGMLIIWYNYELLWIELIVLLIVILFKGINDIVVIFIFYVLWWIYLVVLLMFLVYVF